MKRIGILTGGGDAPGLNAVIRAAVRTAHKQYGLEVLGIEDGFDGLLAEGRTRALSPEDVSGLLSRGGTILGAANRGNPFARKVRRGGKEVIENVSQDALRRVAGLNLEALIVVGGDGTLRISHELYAMGCPIVGVPKTIDNDLNGTDVTFGFDTALNTATEALDKLHSTAESHHRVMVLELMGRDAGWIALEAGVAGGADAILIPEIPFDIAIVADRIRERAFCGSKFSIVAVAEGARPRGGQQRFADAGDETRAPRLGGIGQTVGAQLAELTGMETRVTVLGHLQRGGAPTPFDRWLATRFGAAAVELAAQGRFDHMVALRGMQIVECPLPEALASLKRVEPDGQMVRMAKGLGIVFG